MSNEEQRHREQPVIKTGSLSTNRVYEPTRTTRQQPVTYHSECLKSLLQSSSLVDLRLQCAARAAASSVWAAAAARVTRQCRFLDFQRRPSSRHLLRVSSEGSYFSGALHSSCRPGGGGGLGLESSAATLCHALLVSLSLLRVHHDANFKSAFRIARADLRTSAAKLPFGQRDGGGHQWLSTESNRKDSCLC